MEPTRHILTSFESALENLRKDVLMMSSLFQRSLENARKGLFDRDEDWCNTVIVDDEEIDSLEIKVDTEGMDIMLRYHPVASDLRNVISAMKTSVNIERAADQAVGIARRARKLLAFSTVSDISRIQPMFDHTMAMFADAMKAYADRDPALSETLKPRDKDLDQMNKDFAESMTTLMPENPDSIRAFLELIFVARCLERIGDLAKSIGEDTIYAVSVKDIRHTNQAPVQ
jgi:phosphate transport system protein